MYMHNNDVKNGLVLHLLIVPQPWLLQPCLSDVLQNGDTLPLINKSVTYHIIDFLSLVGETDAVKTLSIVNAGGIRSDSAYKMLTMLHHVKRISSVP